MTRGLVSACKRLKVSNMPFRLLHDNLLRYNGPSAFADVLQPWLKVHSAEVERLRSFKERTGNPIPTATVEELWWLYAISRVFELLALKFQGDCADQNSWSGPAISEEEFAKFARYLGLDVLSPNRYSPFYHEVVQLYSAADADQSTNILRYHWPCLMLGTLLIMRAGVTLTADARVMAPGIADKSMLYWAYRRKNRPYQDLSHGWGGNSQWRTSFRRDYCLGESFHFNVDGKFDLAGLQTVRRNHEGLTVEERKELVVNRCFVISSKPSDDLFPYDDRFSLSSVEAL